MTVHHALRRIVPVATLLTAASTCAALTAASMRAGVAVQTASLAMDTARVTIEGSSNVHAYSAWTDTVRVTRVQLAAPITPDGFWEGIVKPGVVRIAGIERESRSRSPPSAVTTALSCGGSSRC